MGAAGRCLVRIAFVGPKHILIVVSLSHPIEQSMSLTKIQIPDSFRDIAHTSGSEHAIDEAHEAIERFMLADEHFFSNFVNCDFHLVDQAIQWVLQNHVLTGNRFLEYGSGFGATTILAAIHGMEASGIEIESVLVAEAEKLCQGLEVDASFFCGSFVPRGIEGYSDLAIGIEHVDTSEDDVYDQIGFQMNDFDLVFAFPWPGEDGFFESVFEKTASVGAVILTYNGIEGVRLKRKEA